MPITNSRIHPTTFLFGWKFPPEECFSPPFFSDQLKYLNAQLIRYQPSSFQLRKMDENSSNALQDDPSMLSKLLNIGTNEGANAFLEGFSNFNFFSFCVKEIRKLRKKTRLNVDDEELLKSFYGLFNTLAAQADDEIFRAKIPQSEIQDWLDLVIEDIRSMTTKQSWISTGRLDDSDSRARKEDGGRALPDVTICGFIDKIVPFAFTTALHHFEKCWTEEKIFKKFGASGILEQFLRCSTVPQPVSSVEEYGCNIILDHLASCPSILSRKFKSGKPCRDTLKAILDGRDGSRDIQPGILNRLKGIDRLVETIVDTTESINAKLPFLKCDYCPKKGNSEAPLSVCSACRAAYYCSKECQKADWKMHKKRCRNFTKTGNTLSMALAGFLRRSSEPVFQALDEECSRTGVEESDLAVEVDFMPDENGIIPVFHDPPIFRIVRVGDYISGQDVPDWLRGDKVTNCRRALFKDQVKKIMTHGRSASASLLARHASEEYVMPDYFNCEAVKSYKSV